tara:strand:+ start:325 stop:732 length:408 start_codon:yes stop_codon:yes gene_type:complete
MFKHFFLGSLILCFSCKNTITSSELDLLNGYWSIDYITHKNETFYPKGATKLLDFYEVNDREGIRKKIQPQLNNKFLVTKDLNNFKIKFFKKNYYLSFQTIWDQWEEKVIKLNQNKLVLEHQEKRYHYKRFDNKN